MIACGTCGFAGRSRQSVRSHRGRNGHPNPRPICPRCQMRLRHRTSVGHLNGYCQPCDRSKMWEWAQTPIGKQTFRRFRQSERGREYFRQYNQRFRQSEQGRAGERKAAHKRRDDLRGLVQVWQDPWEKVCGRCECPIDPNERHPGNGRHNPLAESVGHEPPRSYAVANGITEVLLRPEHWRCNAWEATTPDHLRPAPPDALHVGHGCARDATARQRKGGMKNRAA